MPFSECLKSPALIKLWGIKAPSARRYGSEYREYPKYTVEINNVIYKIYRHPSLFKSVRVDLFLRKYWQRINVKVPLDLENLTAWEEQAMRVYKSAFDSAQEQLKK